MQPQPLTARKLQLPRPNPQDHGLKHLSWPSPSPLPIKAKGTDPFEVGATPPPPGRLRRCRPRTWGPADLPAGPPEGRIVPGANLLWHLAKWHALAQWKKVHLMLKKASLN